MHAPSNTRPEVPSLVDKTPSYTSMMALSVMMSSMMPTGSSAMESRD